MPLDGVVRGLWRSRHGEGRRRPDRVNRVTYEIAVLEALRERLRCKEIWVVGANRYRNPDDDLPADFEQNREDYYRALNLPSMWSASSPTCRPKCARRCPPSTLAKKNPSVRLSSRAVAGSR